MSDEYDKVIYEEDSRLLSWLMVRQSAELYGEDAEQKLDEMADEEEQWVRAVAKYGKDEQPFIFVKPHSLIAETAIGTYDNTPEEEPKASDWISSETIRPEPKLAIVQHWSGQCGKPLTKCTGKLRNGDLCIHTASTVSAELEADIRQEFKEDWNSMADRPSENFFLGLAGVLFDSGYSTQTHVTCPKCFVLTPVPRFAYQEVACTVCDYAHVQRLTSV